VTKVLQISAKEKKKTFFHTTNILRAAVGELSIALAILRMGTRVETKIFVFVFLRKFREIFFRFS
jgi:hypothetical protein